MAGPVVVLAECERIQYRFAVANGPQRYTEFRLLSVLVWAVGYRVQTL